VRQVLKEPQTMADMPYMHQDWPRYVYFEDGMALLVATPEEAAKYEDCGPTPLGPFTGVVEPAPEPEPDLPPVPAAEA
jgi:hypothetical protein